MTTQPASPLEGLVIHARDHSAPIAGCDWCPIVASAPARTAPRHRTSTSALRDMIDRIDEVLADKTPVRPGEWCAFDGITGTPVVPDLTRGTWPDDVCNKRGLFYVEFAATVPALHVFPGGASVLKRTVTCTRRASHTGRHAAASGGRIVAVWGDRP